MKRTSAGFGYADVENELACRPSTVMRVASLSKPLTAFAVAKLWEDGKLDLDKSIKDYVPEFPEKTYDGKQVRENGCHRREACCAILDSND